MRHPNLIRYYGVAIESTGASYEFFIVTEFMDGGGEEPPDPGVSCWA